MNYRLLQLTGTGALMTRSIQKLEALILRLIPNLMD